MRTLFDPPKAAVEDIAGTPLAERVRPRSLDEVVGQDEVVGETGFLRRALLEDRVPSLVFWGPPGSGKTTLARIIAHETRSHFLPFSAVTSGIKEIKTVMAEAARLRRGTGQSVLLFVDEIHRFNRAQQDAFLPYVERGDIVLMGATTENPSFELNAALLSRCRVVLLHPLETDALVVLLRRALGDAEHGLSRLQVNVEPEALHSMAQLASGDARRALNLLELVVQDAAARGSSAVDPEAVQSVAQTKALLYDKSGEEHFNLISALHKSIRESDPDAAIYWLVRMLESGEDPNYVARRLVRIASEDVGLADPQALPQALAAWDAFRRLGSPEGELALVQATVFLALAEKSTALYQAHDGARDAVANRPADPVPPALRNAPTKLMKDLGYGDGYVYAPATEEGLGGIDCLPQALQGIRFYRPGARGYEKALGARLEEILRRRQEIREKKGGPTSRARR